MKVNGKNMKFKQGKSIINLLDYFKINKDMVVVEINFNIIEQDQYEKYILKSEDNIELISFVGGG